jgi:hypothetical protein
MGGGGGDGGAGAAQRQEADRQARIKAATDAINRIFSGTQRVTGTRVIPGTPGGYQQRATHMGEDSAPWVESVWVPGTPERTEAYERWVDPPGGNPREALYAAQRGAVFDLNRMEVDRQATDAERFSRFGLARSGLMGGSAQIDSVADINRRTNEGLMRAGGIADQAAADLRAADEQARANLISLAQSGIDTGTAASQALNSLQVNSANAASARAGATVGGLFNDLSSAYLMHQANAGRMAGMNNPANQQWYGVSNPRAGNSGTVIR